MIPHYNAQNDTTSRQEEDELCYARHATCLDCGACLEPGGHSGPTMPLYHHPDCSHRLAAAYRVLAERRRRAWGLTAEAARLVEVVAVELPEYRPAITLLDGLAKRLHELAEREAA